MSFELPNTAPKDLLSHLPESIEDLGLAPDDRTSADIDLRSLTHFPRLSSLRIDAYERGLGELLPALTGLHRLNLRSAKKLTDIESLGGLTELRRLALHQLGAVSDLSPLARLPKLRTLGLWRLPKIDDLSTLSKLGALEVLVVEALNAVERFPDAEEMRALRFVTLAAMKALQDFSGLERAPALEELVFQKADHQRPEDFVPVLRNRSLRRGGFGFHKKADVARMSELAAQYGIDAQVFMYPQIRGEVAV